MARTILAGCLIGLLAISAGCKMCAHPYDYCGPTFDGGCTVNCDPYARACSILSPSPYVDSCGGSCGGCVSSAVEPGEELVAETTGVEAVRLRPIPKVAAKPMPGVEEPAHETPGDSPGWVAYNPQQPRR